MTPHPYSRPHDQGTPNAGPSPAQAKEMPRKGRLLVQGSVMLGVLLAAFLIYKGLSQYSFHDILQSVAAVPPTNLARAALFTAGSYFCLTLFDWLGLKYVDAPLSYGRAAFVSFVSLSLAHSIGFAGLSSGAIRYRFYQRWGVPGGDVAKLVLLSGVTVGLGLLSLGGAAFVWWPSTAGRLIHFPDAAIRAAGAVLLALPLVYLALSFFVHGRVTIRRWTLEMPRPWIAAAQVVIGTANYLCVAAVLQAALAAAAHARFPEVAAAFVTGNMLTLMTHVPGGLGVIETTIHYLVPSKTDLIGSLIVFRLVYFIVPLMIGLIMFVAAELAFRRSLPPAKRSASTA